MRAIHIRLRTTRLGHQRVLGSGASFKNSAVVGRDRALTERLECSVGHAPHKGDRKREPRTDMRQPPSASNASQVLSGAHIRVHPQVLAPGVQHGAKAGHLSCRPQ